MKIFQASADALPQHGVDVMIGLIAMRAGFHHCLGGN
jgi:hypothetical protein